MKIAIISTMAAYPWGGSEELWAQMAVEAINANHQVMALIPKWNPRHEKVNSLERIGVKISEWSDKFTYPENNTAHGKSPWYPYESLIEFSPDIIVISHGGFLDMVNGHSLLFALLIQLGIPYISIIQANTDLYSMENAHRSFMQEYLPRANAVVFVSKENLRFGQRHLARKLENACVINNPVNLKNYDEVTWPESSLTSFACVARFDSFAKGHDILFEVLGQEKWLQRNWTMSLYGAGEHESYLRDLISFYRLTDKVIFKGTSSDVRQIWESHQILVLASRLEGTPLVLMEAMLCGRPAVVTSVGGNSDWVLDGKTGFLAEAANFKLMDRALERAWIKRDEWREIGSHAREFFKKNHEVNSGATLLKLVREECRA